MIIKPSDAFRQSADWVSADVRAYIKDQVSTHVDTVQDVRDNDFEQTRFVYVKSKASTYRLDLSSGADDDGDTVLRDNLGRRYVKVAGAGGLRPWDVQVDTLSDRAAYDGQPAGYVVLVSDAGGGRAAIYTMGAGGSGDWSDPAYLTPPAVGGDVVGPSSAADGNVAVFDGDGRHLRDAGYAPIDPAALALALGDKADAATVAAHINNTSNPHAVTADQVGAATPGKAIALAMIFGG